MRKGWEYKKLGEVTSFFRGLTYSGKDEVDYSNNIVLRSNNIDLSTNSLNFDELKFISNSITIPQDKKLKKNSIFMCMSNGSKQHLGKVAFIEKDYPYAFGGFMGLIVPNEDKLVPKFTYYYFCSQKFKTYLSTIGNGANINNIKYIDIAKDSIPLPPLSTQLSIVSELDKINELIRLKKEQLKDFDNLAQSIFYEMFGDPVENEKEWEVKKLGKVCTIERGGSPRPITKYITDSKDGINWIKIGDAKEGSKYITSTKEKIKPEGVKKSRFVHKGDFILSNSMSFGKPYILKIDGCIHDGWLVIHDNNNIFIKTYLYYLLSSSIMYAKFSQLAVGGVVNNLNSSLVRKVDIPLPPLPLQHLFAQRIEQIERQKSAVQKSITDLETLLASRMQYWFE